MPRPARGEAAGAGTLAGARILVTRPRERAAGLLRALSARGAAVLDLPAIEIAPPREPDAARAALRRIAPGDRVLFTSPAAVERALGLLGGAPGNLVRARLGAVGAATARALGAVGLAVELAPRERFDSEALLALPELGPEAVRGARVWIVKGEGGRGLLEEALAGRGARVGAVDVYRRVRPAEESAGPAREALARGELDAVVVTSAEAAGNLVALLAGQGERLRALQPVTVSPRVAGALAALGFRREALVAERAADEALVETLERWWAGEGHR